MIMNKEEKKQQNQLSEEELKNVTGGTNEVITGVKKDGNPDLDTIKLHPESQRY